MGVRVLLLLVITGGCCGCAIGRPVIANVMHGGHFVLVVGYDTIDGDTLYVNDPGFDIEVVYPTVVPPCLCPCSCPALHRVHTYLPCLSHTAYRVGSLPLSEFVLSAALYGYKGLKNNE